MIDMVGKAEVAAGHVFAGFCEKLNVSRRTETCGETEVPGTYRSKERFAASCFNSDDELLVFLQQLEDGVASREVSEHSHSKG